MILFLAARHRKVSPSRAARAHFPFVYLSLFISLLAFHNTLRAQDVSDGDVIRVRTNLVTVPAYVTDARGGRIKNLTAADFALRDDGRAVKIEYFAAGTEHVALLFALDASGSTREIIEQQRETALALFSRFGQGSKVSVMRFAEQAEIVAPFSSTPDEALAAFNLPVLKNRRTAIFDAAARALQAFDERSQNATERRIIILISDGLDTVSATRPREVIDAARARGVSLYAIQLPLYTPRDGRLAPRPATKGFREMAEQTGGRFFIAGNAKSALAVNPLYDLSPIFRAIEEDLQGQYVLGFYPAETEQDGRFHQFDLSLTIKDKRKLRVRLLREGYKISDE
jgi:VWFA-related protein